MAVRKGKDDTPKPDSVTVLPQGQNARIHTQRSVDALGQSVQEVKWFGAVTAIKPAGKDDLVCIDGSSRVRTAFPLLDEEKIIVESDGTKPIVVVRTDIDDENSTEARRISVAANRIQEWGTWDVDVLEEWGDAVTNELFTEEELELERAAAEAAGSMDAEGAIEPTWSPDDEPVGADDAGINYQSKYAIAIECDDEDHQQQVYETLVEQGYKCKVLTL